MSYGCLSSLQLLPITHTVALRYRSRSFEPCTRNLVCQRYDTPLRGKGFSSDVRSLFGPRAKGLRLVKEEKRRGLYKYGRSRKERPIYIRFFRHRHVTNTDNHSPSFSQHKVCTHPPPNTDTLTSCCESRYQKPCTSLTVKLLLYCIFITRGAYKYDIQKRNCTCVFGNRFLEKPDFTPTKSPSS
jgi:hypothetical protein